MKKPIQILLLFSLWAMLLPSVCKAGTPTEDKIVLSDLTYQSSSGLYYFDASLEGSQTYCAYNLDIFLPEGIEVATNTSGSYRVTMLKTSAAVYPYETSIELDEEDNEVEVKTYPHQVLCSMPQTRQLRIACYAAANQEFVKTSGKLFRVYVSLDAATLSASFSPKPIVTVSGVALTKKENAAQFDPADYSCRPFTTGIPASRTLPVNINATNKVGTLILPFSADLPEGIKAYTCAAVDTDSKQLTLESADTFEACTPYIVYAENGYSGNISGTVNLSADYPDADVYAEGYLTGVLTTTVVNTGYILQNQGDGPTFYDAEGSSFSLPAGRCYLTPTTPLEAKAFRIIPNDASDIRNIQHTSTATPTDYYDLSGRRIVRPLKGIYLRGNNKVLIP
ncbi:MAG: hypothetical protein IJT97_07560 [Bacteroidaceae bacterium]|nr:hypothetical protein [Bacteroidaceae bacterium]